MGILEIIKSILECCEYKTYRGVINTPQAEHTKNEMIPAH